MTTQSDCLPVCINNNTASGLFWNGNTKNLHLQNNNNQTISFTNINDFYDLNVNGSFFFNGREVDLSLNTTLQQEVDDISAELHQFETTVNNQITTINNDITQINTTVTEIDNDYVSLTRNNELLGRNIFENISYFRKTLSMLNGTGVNLIEWKQYTSTDTLADIGLQVRQGAYGMYIKTANDNIKIIQVFKITFSQILLMLV